jgi:hypothetical protein
MMKTANILEKIKQTEKTQPRTTDRMEAIAWGVQARFEESTGYSKKVTDETINIARSLGLSNAEIERWVNNRQNQLAQDTEKFREIKSLLSKV